MPSAIVPLNSQIQQTSTSPVVSGSGSSQLPYATTSSATSGPYVYTPPTSGSIDTSGISPSIINQTYQYGTQTIPLTTSSYQQQQIQQLQQQQLQQQIQQQQQAYTYGSFAPYKNTLTTITFSNAPTNPSGSGSGAGSGTGTSIGTGTGTSIGTGTVCPIHLQSTLLL
jgi:hypothetical protein